MDGLQETRLLDFRNQEIQSLVNKRQWRGLPEKARIGRIYDFVRDEIPFGYNRQDDLPASRVLRDGFGQCNTKGVLFMALLRASGVRCRFHGFEIDKALQNGAIAGLWYHWSPRFILHSWVEVECEGSWYNLEGFILDLPYLRALQRRFPLSTSFCGFGAATKDLQRPPVDWDGCDTYIQSEGITKDYGVFADPDAFFSFHRQKLNPLKTWLFQNVARHRFNAKVRRIRHSGLPTSAPPR